MTPRYVTALLLLVALAGCSARGEISAGDSTPSSQAPAESATPTPTPTATEPRTDLADGRHYARVTAYDPDDRELTVDVVQWFEGDAAVAAAVDDGYQADDVANDYYVRNENKRLRTLTIRAGTDIVVNTIAFERNGSSTKDTVITGAELVAYLDAGTAQRALFWFELEGGTIVTLHEQFLP